MKPIPFGEAVSGLITITVEDGKEYTGLFSDIRVSRGTVPKGLYAYDLRDDDDCSYTPCQVQKFVLVNYLGTIITKTPIVNIDSGPCVIDSYFPEMDEKSAYTIKFHILKYAPLMNGIKLTNRWGGKGEVGTILPDDKMPYDMATGEHYDCLINSSSVIKRKNPPQVYEALITKICNAVYKKVKSFMEKGNVAGAKKFADAYGHTFGKDMTDAQFKKKFAEDGLSMFQLKVGCYLKYPPETLLKWAKSLGVSEHAEVFMPGIGKVETPIITGQVYMMRLYHSSDYEGKVTSDLVDSKEPHMGRGLYRGKSELTGQKIGEMDQWALRASGAGEYVNKHRVNFLDSQYILLNEMLMAGMYVKSAEGLPILSPRWEREKKARQ